MTGKMLERRNRQVRILEAVRAGGRCREVAVREGVTAQYCRMLARKAGVDLGEQRARRQPDEIGEGRVEEAVEVEIEAGMSVRGYRDRRAEEVAERGARQERQEEEAAAAAGRLAKVTALYKDVARGTGAGS